MLGVGVVFQMSDQAGPEFPHIGFDLAAVLPEGVQFGHNDLITVSLPIAVPAGDQRPGHNNDEDSDGADYLADLC